MCITTGTERIRITLASVAMHDSSLQSDWPVEFHVSGVVGACCLRFHLQHWGARCCGVGLDRPFAVCNVIVTSLVLHVYGDGCCAAVGRLLLLGLHCGVRGEWCGLVILQWCALRTGVCTRLLPFAIVV